MKTNKQKLSHSENTPYVFLFPGYGEQHHGMARRLFRNIPFFREQMERCAAIVENKTSINFLNIIYGDLNNANKSVFEKHLISGVSLFAVEYSIAKYLISLGIVPSSMLGYSMGEYTSACIAEAISLEDTIDLLIKQAKFIDELPGGSMMAVQLSQKDACKYLVKNKVDLAAVNGAKTSILSGNTENIKKTKALIRKEHRIESIILNSNHGFHSYLVESIMDDVSNIAKSISFSENKIKYISSITGDWITYNDLKDPTYWSRKLRMPVLFELGLQKIINNPNVVFIEIGPRQTLSLIVKNHTQFSKTQTVISTLPHFPDEEDDYCFFKNSLEKIEELSTIF